MFRVPLEKFGSVGALIAAAACPVCFPKVALIAAIFGLGFLEQYEGYATRAVQVFALVAFVGQIVAFPRHRNGWLLGFSAAATALLFVAYYAIDFSPFVLQLGLVCVIAASVWLVVELRRCAKRKAVSEQPNCCPTTTS